MPEGSNGEDSSNVPHLGSLSTTQALGHVILQEDVHAMVPSSDESKNSIACLAIPHEHTEEFIPEVLPFLVRILRIYIFVCHFSPAIIAKTASNDHTRLEEEGRVVKVAFEGPSEVCMDHLLREGHLVNKFFRPAIFDSKVSRADSKNTNGENCVDEVLKAGDDGVGHLLILGSLFDPIFKVTILEEDGHGARLTEESEACHLDDRRELLLHQVSLPCSQLRFIRGTITVVEGEGLEAQREAHQLRRDL